jgi:hypothetical protein
MKRKEQKEEFCFRLRIMSQELLSLIQQLEEDLNQEPLEPEVIWLQKENDRLIEEIRKLDYLRQG